MKPVRKAGSAEKFSQLFDNGWTQKTSTIRNKSAEEKTYDALYSWEGRADNHTSFSRLEATDMPVQHTKPVTMAGKQVILLEKYGNPEIFCGTNVKAAVPIPLTQKQKDLGMLPDLSGTVPIFDQARMEGKEVIIVEPQGFRNMKSSAAEFIIADIPKALKAAGPQCDQKLLTPQQRREILDFEKRVRDANMYIGDAMMVRETLRNQVGTLAFQRGVVGIDSNANEDSEIYGAQARAKREAIENSLRFKEARRAQLCVNTSSSIVSSKGSGARTGAEEKVGQSKGGTHRAPTFEQTHNNLFAQNIKTIDEDRRQLIRDRDLDGRPYNLITHTMHEHMPPRQGQNPVERRENKFLDHPSQTSLEGPRNFQGSLRPY